MSRPTEPLISCLMVTRNRRSLAERAVRCFAAQTWERKELVIVDDGDEDYAPMLAPYIAAGVAIRYHRIELRPDVLLGGLRNLTLDLAEGECCMQWDDDEWYGADRIEVQAAHLGDGAAVALRWTLMSVESPTLGRLAFRSDAGIATPGTILHRRTDVRYPNVRRGEDSVFLRDLRRDGLTVLGAEQSHLFVRCFHGDNTWDEQHFLRRLRRRPADWPSYATSMWWHRDVRRHKAFRLTDAERACIAELDADTERTRSIETEAGHRG
jgi:glycosyltransferase involved in cell wall biosynthesis